MPGDLIRTLRSLRKEARRNDHDIVEALNLLHAKPGQGPSPTALGSIAEWAIVEDRGDVAHAVFSDMIQQIVPGDGTVLRAWKMPRRVRAKRH